MPRRSLLDASTAPTALVAAAREIAASVFNATSREDLADMVLSGKGDDFPEVTAILAGLGELSARSQILEDALRVYADPEFWDDELPGGSLAHHDGGEAARNALSGRRPFFHRD